MTPKMVQSDLIMSIQVIQVGDKGVPTRNRVVEIVFFVDFIRLWEK